MKEISIPFQLTKGFFLERPNRFLIRCKLEDSETIVNAHLADSGRLRELLIPGREIFIAPAENKGRKTEWTAVLCESPDGQRLVSVNSTLPNRLIGKALAEQALEELADWVLVRSEYTMGDSRWDFLLARGEKKLLLEVKGVTLVKEGIAYFPDAITARGAKHLRELAHLREKEGWEGAVLFLLQRDDSDHIRAAKEIDPDFSAALVKAERTGVRILGRKCHISRTEMKLGEPVRVTP